MAHKEDNSASNVKVKTQGNNRERPSRQVHKYLTCMRASAPKQSSTSVTGGKCPTLRIFMFDENKIHPRIVWVLSPDSDRIKTHAALMPKPRDV